MNEEMKAEIKRAARHILDNYDTIIEPKIPNMVEDIREIIELCKSGNYTEEELELINEKLISITYDGYGEVLNGKSTYKGIAKLLKDGKTVGIGWTDMLGTHLDIIFKLGLDVKFGNFQRGIKASDLFVSIIGFTSYGFKTDSIKEGTYIQEKLDMRDETGDELANLINGIIGELNEISN